MSSRAFCAGKPSERSQRETARQFNYELVRILPTCLASAAFHLWESLPATVQSDHKTVKEILKEVLRAGGKCSFFFFVFYFVESGGKCWWKVACKRKKMDWGRT